MARVTGRESQALVQTCFRKLCALAKLVGSDSRGWSEIGIHWEV